MTTKNNGGPAFPESGPRGVAVGGKGITLRDVMALSVPMPDEFAISWATALVGSPLPGLGAKVIEQIDWWARAEAAYRYRIADAMLKAREEA